jgi:hypothetical protein
MVTCELGCAGCSREAVIHRAPLPSTDHALRLSPWRSGCHGCRMGSARCARGLAAAKARQSWSTDASSLGIPLADSSGRVTLSMKARSCGHPFASQPLANAGACIGSLPGSGGRSDGSDRDRRPGATLRERVRRTVGLADRNDLLAGPVLSHGSDSLLDADIAVRRWEPTMVAAQPVPNPPKPAPTRQPPTPPGEPPPGVTSEVLWRLAVRLFTDHHRESLAAAGGPHCGSCRQPWPCSGRRLAELGLNRARV